jgi:ADP-dependent NAD(P)H-hydrate dehydratase / NAD(P)H-hydrate epimerase
MKIFSAAQIRDWDRYTMDHEPISSLDLMERASLACVHEIFRLLPSPLRLIVLAGPGNNGGDGLAIARLCREKGIGVQVYHPGHEGISRDNLANLHRYENFYGKVLPLEEFLTETPDPEAWIVDALFGSGLERSLQDIYRQITGKVNAAWDRVISIDLPSGMIPDAPSDLTSVIRAQYTLTFQAMKLAFLLPSTGEYCGEIRVLDIGLSAAYRDKTDTPYEFTERQDISRLLRRRARFSHKGDYGSCLLLAGQKGMMGAAILAAKACFRTGVGKLVCRVPSEGLLALQTAVPEAICSPDENRDHLETIPDLGGYRSIAIGPGIGTHQKTGDLLSAILEQASVPLVLDADALNLLAINGWQSKLRPGMVITPHPGEFSRLFGHYRDDFSRLAACQRLSTTLGICLVLKGHFTCLSTSRGKALFNSTGNPGMAKAGSGDVLTGVIAAFLAQEYSIDDASRISVYLHGLAGDLAAERWGMAGMMPSDLVDLLGKTREQC